MTNTIFYLSETAEGYYSQDSLDYINNTFGFDTITSIASTYGVSAMSIAGAIAREYDRWGQVDDYQDASARALILQFDRTQEEWEE